MELHVIYIGGDVKYDSNKLTQKKKVLEILFHFVTSKKIPFLPRIKQSDRKNYIILYFLVEVH